MLLASGLFLLLTRPTAVERPVDFAGVGGFTLHGTFLAPSSTEKLPAVLLIPGSGPTDRDGNQQASLISNLLKQVADRLAAEGIASYRFDKRAVSTYYSLWPKDIEAFNTFMSFGNFVGDVRLAFITLGKQPEVDPKRLALVGHSEGCLLSLEICSKFRSSEQPKALVLLGAPGRTVGVVLRQQLKELFERQKLFPEAQQKNMDLVNKGIEQVSKDGTAPKDMPDTPLFRALFSPRSTKMMQGLFTEDPIKLAPKYPGPVLLITGEYDQAVSPTQDLEPLRAAFKQRKSGSVDSFIAPHGSHGLKEAPDRDHDTFAGPVIPSALDLIAKWLHQHM